MKQPGRPAWSAGSHFCSRLADIRRQTFLFSSGCLFLAVTAFAASAQPKPSPAAPVAPIQARDFAGWGDVLVLENETLTLGISPAAGRLIHLSYRLQPNLLRLNEETAGVQPEGKHPDFLNHGGDWLWPIAQTNWHHFGKGDWPPALLIEGRPWSGRAWELADGTLKAELVQDYAAPLDIRVTRTFTLNPGQSFFTIDQLAESKRDGSLPITLWNITQIGDAEYALMPQDTPDDIIPMMFGDPDPESIQSCSGMLVYTPEPNAIRKLGGKNRASWIAAMKNDTLILEVMTEPNPNAPHPDGDVTVEMFSGADPKYIEIETLGEERVLGQGEKIENRISVGLIKNPDVEAPCDWKESIENFLQDHAHPPLETD